MTKVYLVQYRHLTLPATMPHLAVSTVHSSYDDAARRITEFMAKYTNDTEWYISEVVVDEPCVPHKITFVAGRE